MNKSHSLIGRDYWRLALWLNLSLNSLKVLEIIDCRQLTSQLVESFGYRQARLYVSKFFEPNLRSPRKIHTQVFGHTLHISFLRHLYEENHTSSRHLNLYWAAVGKLLLHLTQLIGPLTSWARVCLLSLSWYSE